MPTVLKKDGFVRIYPNDHLPAHVHVFKLWEAINLLGENGCPEFISVTLRMSDRDATKALRLLQLTESCLKSEGVSWLTRWNKKPLAEKLL